MRYRVRVARVEEMVAGSAFGLVSSLCPLPSKVSMDRAGGFGHCGNVSAEKWVGVIPQCMAALSPSNGLPPLVSLAWGWVPGREQGCSDPSWWGGWGTGQAEPTGCGWLDMENKAQATQNLRPLTVPGALGTLPEVLCQGVF